MKINCIKLVLGIFLSCIASPAYFNAQTTDVFSTPGTTNWTVPAGVSSITVECWGGGGAGGGVNMNSGITQGAAGGGGKGGMYSLTTIAVTEGMVLTVNVGAGGTGTIGAGNAGGATWVSTTANAPWISVTGAWASGGNGGSGATTNIGNGATGYASPSTGSGTVFQSGNGAAGRRLASANQAGGGGGGGAGTTSNGTDAVVSPTNGAGSPTAQSAGGLGGSLNGGNGGAGAFASSTGSTVGVAGSVRGGAGGGSRCKNDGGGAKSAAGGAGARGEVRISFTPVVCSVNVGTALANICQGATTSPLGGTVSGLATTGIWSDGGVGGTFLPTATDLNATWTAPVGFTGNVTLTLTTTNGCATPVSNSKAGIVVDVPQLPVFVSGATSICENGQETYVATSSGTGVSLIYSVLSPNASVNAASGLVTNAIDDFIIRATASNNCGTNFTDLAVIVNPLPTTPTITASGALTFCSGGSVELTSSATVGNEWSTNATSNSIQVSTAGSYSVTVTDANGCEATSTPVSVVVNSQPTAPTITASDALTFCSGGSVELTSSATAGNEWSTNATSNSIQVSTAGSYSVTLTDANGCEATSTPVNVVVNSLPTAPTITASGALTFCSGGSVELTSSATAGNEWSTNATSNSIQVSTAGSYSVTITDVNGCEATSIPVSVVVNTAPQANVAIQSSNVLIASPVGQSYEWINCTTGQAIPNQTNSTLTLVQNGSYAVVVTNSSGCSDTSSCIQVSDLSVNSLTNNWEVVLYPNPASSQLMIKSHLDFVAQVSFLDLSGKLILKINNVYSNTSIDISALSSGMYFALLEMDNRIQKVILTKE